MRKLAATWAMLIVAAWCSQAVAAEPVTTVILVRHAEKETGGNDPGLTPDGRARAAELARALAAVELDAVFSTQFRRTRDTAGPVAEDHGLSVTVDPAGGNELAAYARELSGRLLETQAGRTILVVGHSNTIPALIEALGAGKVAIGEQTYDDLFVVTVPPDGDPGLLHLHYGEPSRIASTDD